jgi:phospholipase C
MGVPSATRIVVYFSGVLRAAKVAFLLSVALGLGIGLLPATFAAGPAGESAPKTPIKHLVVIFQENHSFDVYFGTYPIALNPPGQPAFRARPGTPSVNGLTPTLS